MSSNFEHLWECWGCARGKTITFHTVNDRLPQRKITVIFVFARYIAGYPWLSQGQIKQGVINQMYIKAKEAKDGVIINEFEFHAR